MYILGINIEIIDKFNFPCIKAIRQNMGFLLINVLVVLFFFTTIYRQDLKIR